MPRAGRFSSRGLWEQSGPTTCFSSVLIFSHRMTGPLTPSGSRGEWSPRVGGSPLPTHKARVPPGGALAVPRTQNQTSYSKSLCFLPSFLVLPLAFFIWFLSPRMSSILPSASFNQCYPLRPISLRVSPILEVFSTASILQLSSIQLSTRHL